MVSNDCLVFSLQSYSTLVKLFIFCRIFSYCLKLGVYLSLYAVLKIYDYVMTVHLVLIVLREHILTLCKNPALCIRDYMISVLCSESRSEHLLQTF